MAHQESNNWAEAERIAKWLLERTVIRPKVAVVLGSGLGSLDEVLTNKNVIPYADIPGFPISTVPGHKGNLIFGLVGDCEQKVQVVLMQGRFHAYEGYSMNMLTLPMRVFKMLGCTTVMLTNAAGSLSDKISAGDVMIINSHINLPGMCGYNPLCGPNNEAIGPRFPSLSNAYDLKLRQQLAAAFTAKSFPGKVHTGVYAFQAGPCFESVAEVHMLRAIGADAVGMSTVPEAIVAHHCGLTVVAMSLITNLCIGDFDSDETVSHEDVQLVANMRAESLKDCVKHFLGSINL